MKKTIFSFCMTLFMAVLMTGCSSDDDEIFQNGPAGFCKDGYTNHYPSGTVIIELKGNGKIVFNYEDGKVETLDYSIPEDQEKYGSTLPVMNIDEVPFGYAIEGNSLKLHYYGFYFCDHIPATFVFKRTK